jgi:hypothetical protein
MQETMYIFVSICLILMAGLMSGLTLGWVALCELRSLHRSMRSRANGRGWCGTARCTCVDGRTRHRLLSASAACGGQGSCIRAQVA